MKRIEWENYQDGDSTPLNAENLNLMQDNIEEALESANKPEFLQLSARLVAIGSTQINTFESSIDKSNGKLIPQDIGFKVGFGVSMIEVSAQVFYGALSSPSANLNVEIQKNGNPVNRVANHIDSSTYRSIPLLPLTIDVKQNDIITVNLPTAGSNSRIYGWDETTGDRTWLLAKIIE